jgi:hypothetical protein
VNSLLILAQHGTPPVDLGEWGPPAHTWLWVYAGAAVASLTVVVLTLWSWRSDDLGRGETAARVALLAATVVSLVLLGLAVQRILEPPLSGGMRDSAAAVSQALTLGGAGVAVGVVTAVGFFLTPAMRERLAA